MNELILQSTNLSLTNPSNQFATFSTNINSIYSFHCTKATSSLDMSVLVRVYMGSEDFILNPVRAIVEKKSITDFAIHPWSGGFKPGPIRKLSTKNQQTKTTQDMSHISSP